MDSASAIKIIVALAKPLGAASLKRLKKLKAIEEFRIEQAIESAFAEVWESLDAFFISEGVSESKRLLVASACEGELRPFANDVSLLLGGSLDGEKLFEQIRSQTPFPREIRDEKLEQVYRMIFPLVASIVCRAPVIVEQIEEKSLSEILARFDQLKDQVSTVSSGIAQLRQEPQRRFDELYGRVLQQALKKVLLGVEVTGLYGDSPLKQAKEEMFVLPAIQEELRQSERELGKQEPRLAEETDEHGGAFLSKGARSIVRGAPGAGKSTWSRWLQAHALRKWGMLTLYVKLRSWQDGSLPPIIDLVEELVGTNMAREISAEAVAKWIKQGGIAVILDGFDEVAPDRRDSMLRSIEDLAGYIDGGTCLVTSRPLHTDHLFQLAHGWTSWMIQSFDDQRILDYIERWYRHAPLKEGATRDIDAKLLHALLVKDPHVQPLTRNPLMLATLLMVHHNDGELPKGRSRLYARYIDGMLGIWDDRQEVHADLSGLDREQKKRILTSIAISLHLDNKDELEESKAIDLMGEAIRAYGYRADARQVLDSLRERSGLIIGPGSYSFSHKSVGEYLVAHAICDGDRVVRGERLDRFLLHSVRTNDRWLNVIYFWAGQTSVADVQSFIEALNNNDDLSLWIGLLWDQMDRFQRDWLEGQLRSALEFADLIDLTNVSRDFRWLCWKLGEPASTSDREEARGLAIPMRHVVEPYLSFDELKPLFRQIGINNHSLPHCETLALYNLMFAAVLNTEVGNVDAMRVISENSRWSGWLKNSQASVQAFSLAVETTVEEALQAWYESNPDIEGMAEIWIAAAWLPRVEFRWTGEREKNPGKDLEILSSILVRPWSNQALAMSTRYYAINVFFGGKKDDRDGQHDLFKIIGESVDSLAKKHGEKVAGIAETVVHQLAELVQRRSELE